MTLTLKNKTKLIISIISILVIIIAVNLIPNAFSNQSTFGIGEYFFKVPSDWEAIGDKNEVIFKKGNQLVGGIQIINYYPKEPLFIPNHSQIVDKKDIKGLITKAQLLNLNLTQPAASDNKSIKNQNHLYLIFEKDKIAYDIYADSKFLSESKLINIAKSFEHKK